MRFRHITKLVAVATLLAPTAFAAPAPGTDARSPVPVPDGFVVANGERLADGVHHVALAAGGDAQQVNVARLRAGSPFALRAVLSNGTIAPAGARLERTSSMCARQSCLVAVNADFAALGTNEPVGGVVVAGELVRSPNPLHHQLNVADDGSLSMGTLDWSSRFVSTDLAEFSVDGVNVARGGDQLVLYTQRFGPTTAQNAHGVEMVLEIVEPAAPLLLDQTHVLRVVDVRVGQPGARIHANQVILSGHGKGARVLEDLAARIDAGEAGPTLLSRLHAGGVIQSVGGTPVLVRNGKRYVGNDGSNFRAGNHPRTLVGWTAGGDTLLVTVDGRQPGRARGMSLIEAADLMVSLGAVEALNLDGGGSATFVRQGEVVNRPSDTLVARAGARRTVPVPGAGDVVLGSLERPVVSSLIVVPRERAVMPAGPAPMPEALSLPPAAAAAAAQVDETRSADPGSNPVHLPSLPELVWEATAPGRAAEDLPANLALASVVALVMAAGASGAVLRGRLERLAFARTPDRG